MDSNSRMKHTAGLCSKPGMESSPLLPQLPPHLVAFLDGWGVGMRNSVQAARDSCLQQLCKTGVRVLEWQPALASCTFRIATDCSGADAPIWACRQTQLKHVHVFSSDIWPASRSFLKCNTPPREVMYADMCAPRCGLPQHDVYVCGFPCQPFSTLRTKSRFSKRKRRNPSGRH